jgi:hypothetical protein
MSDEEWKSYLINERGYNENDEEGMKGYSDWLDSFEIKSEDDYEKWLDTVALRPGTAAFTNYLNDVLDLIEYANAEASSSYWALSELKTAMRLPLISNILQSATKTGEKPISETLMKYIKPLRLNILI